MTDIERQNRLKTKQGYFRSFDSHAADSDDEPDAGRQQSMLRLGSVRAVKWVSAAKSRPGPSDSSSRTPPDIHAEKLNRTPSTSLQPLPSIPGAAPPASPREGIACTGVASATVAAESTSSLAAPQISSKRKRAVKVNLVPQGQQIFRGLYFYFFPPGDKHPARRMRITKAMSFGATWCKEWDRNVTHVIVDKEIEYGLLLKYLKVDALPTNVLLVSENYPSECICYRTMLDAKQRHFVVEGFIPSGIAEKASVSLSHSNQSDRSLKLKPAGKSVTTRQAGTPATTIT